MTRVYLSVANAEERSAFRLLLSDMKMEFVGEAADWASTLTQAPGLFVDMLVVDWEVLPDPQNTAMEALRQACPAALVIVLVSHLDPRQQAALSAGADAFISKSETPERVLERLRLAARNLQALAQNGPGP